jgi:replicative DNA helicase
LSLFENFVVACINKNSLEGFKLFDIDKHSIDEPEKALYEFVNLYFDKYRKLPKLTEVETKFNLSGVDDFDIDNPEYYLELIIEHTKKDLFNKNFSNVNKQIKEDNFPGALDSIRHTVEKIDTLVPENVVSDFDTEIVSSLSEYQENIFKPSSNGYTLGFDFLNDLNGGCYPGNLIVLGARMGRGKTYVMLHMLKEAWLEGHSIGCCSGEMSVKELVDRILCLCARLDSNKFTKKMLCSRAWQLLNKTYEELKPRLAEDRLWFINAAKYGDAHELCIRDIERLIAQKKPKIFFIDAVYLFKLDNKPTYKKADHEIVKAVLNRLKAIAEKYQVCIICTSQVNREANENKPLSLKNFSDTDNFGKIAHLVLGIRKCDELPDPSNMRIIDVLKNRTGLDDIPSRWINFNIKHGDISEIDEAEQYLRETNPMVLV